MLPSSQLRPDRVLPDTGRTVLGVKKHGEKRMMLDDLAQSSYEVLGPGLHCITKKQANTSYSQKVSGILGQPLPGLSNSSKRLHYLLLGRSCTPLKDPG